MTWYAIRRRGKPSLYFQYEPHPLESPVSIARSILRVMVLSAHIGLSMIETPPKLFKAGTVDLGRGRSIEYFAEHL